jgi:hypothetical protein
VCAADFFRYQQNFLVYLAKNICQELATLNMTNFLFVQAVCRPLMAKSICTYRRAKIAVVIITAFSIGKLM